MINAVELRTKTTQEIQQILSELRRQQFKLRLVKASGELTKTHEIKKLRRYIARVETILKELKGSTK